MIINESDFEKRIKNPLNLLNKERNIDPDKKNAMSLFIKPAVVKKIETPKFVPSFPRPVENKATEESIDDEKQSSALSHVPSVAVNEIRADDILRDVDANIKLAQVHGKALDLMQGAMGILETKMPGMKADRIPGLVASLGKVITDIRKEQSERNKSSINENVHYHFYCPEPKKLEQYEVIEVG
jgi:hypothetical protein